MWKLYSVTDIILFLWGSQAVLQSWIGDIPYWWLSLYCGLLVRTSRIWCNQISGKSFFPVITVFTLYNMLSLLKYFSHDLMPWVQQLWQCWKHSRTSCVLNSASAVCECSWIMMISFPSVPNWSEGSNTQTQFCFCLLVSTWDTNSVTIQHMKYCYHRVTLCFLD
jgi:hypothetical protein